MKTSPIPCPLWAQGLSAQDIRYAVCLWGMEPKEFDAKLASLTPVQQSWAYELIERIMIDGPEEGHPLEGYADEPALIGSISRPDAEVPVDPWMLVSQAVGHASGSDPLDLVAQLQAIDKLTAWSQAQAHRVLGMIAPPEDGPYVEGKHVIEEVQVARRCGDWAANTALNNARTAGQVFTGMLDALEAGETSDAHLRALISETACVTDTPAFEGRPAAQDQDRDSKLRRIEARVLHRARTETVSRFRRSVQAAICAVDSEGEAERRAVAKTGRMVSIRPDTEGMGQLYARDDITTMQRIHTELTRRARLLQKERGGSTAARSDADATLAACRADALAAAVLGTNGPETLEVREPQVEIHLVMDLATLRREQDNPCTLDGQPIPAQVGREIAGRYGRAWRRMVIAPVTGHLLDYGDRTYLPAKLTKFIHARDGGCTAPYCERPASRCQMDHRMPFPNGPSSSTNCHLQCDRHHPLKTDGYVTCTDGNADGSMTWTTLWGQQVSVPPRPFLDNPMPEELQPEEQYPEELQPEELQPEELQPEELQLEDPQPDVQQPEDPQPEDPQSEGRNPRHLDPPPF